MATCDLSTEGKHIVVVDDRWDIFWERLIIQKSAVHRTYVFDDDLLLLLAQLQRLDNQSYFVLEIKTQ